MCSGESDVVQIMFVRLLPEVRLSLAETQHTHGNASLEDPRSASLDDCRTPDAMYAETRVDFPRGIASLLP